MLKWRGHKSSVESTPSNLAYEGWTSGENFMVTDRWQSSQGTTMARYRCNDIGATTINWEQTQQCQGFEILSFITINVIDNIRVGFFLQY